MSEYEGDEMTGHNKSNQARKGLIDSVKGKVKEVFGAVSGNDSLTAEGQLEQTQAQVRKEANTVEAVADAQAARAREEAAEAAAQSTQQRAALNAQTAAAESSARAQAANQKRAAEQAAHEDAAHAKTTAENNALREVQHAKAAEREEISDAAQEITDAAAKHESSVQVAQSTQAEADRIRRHADLPRAQNETGVIE
jgi:uncharacterized protein YjbJ (UPF0337 family)